MPTEISKIDLRLLAIARGHLADPSSVPMNNLEAAEPVLAEVQVATPTRSGLVPTLRLCSDAIRHLLISDEARLLVAHVDGTRTVEQIFGMCDLDERESGWMLDELVRFGAIELY